MFPLSAWHFLWVSGKCQSPQVKKQVDECQLFQTDITSRSLTEREQEEIEKEKTFHLIDSWNM